MNKNLFIPPKAVYGDIVHVKYPNNYVARIQASMLEAIDDEPLVWTYLATDPTEPDMSEWVNSGEITLINYARSTTQIMGDFAISIYEYGLGMYTPKENNEWGWYIALANTDDEDPIYDENGQIAHLEIIDGLNAAGPFGSREEAMEWAYGIAREEGPKALLNRILTLTQTT